MHYEIYIDVVFFHKSPDRLHIDQIYRNIIPMWKKQKKSSSGSCCRCGVFLLDHLSAIFSEVWDFSSGTCPAAWWLCCRNACDRM